MPTGYTSDLYEGKKISFTEFALQCARAFGAAIDQRDDARDAPLRLPVPRLDHHEEGLAKAKALLAEVQAMPMEVAREHADADHDAALAHWHKSEASRITRERDYRNMLAEVEKWTPPSPDHEGMKKFMREQLEESIRFDCTYRYEPPKSEGAADWSEAQKVRAFKDIEYHTKQLADEVERVTGRRKWIADLAASLDVPVEDDVVVA